VARAFLVLVLLTAAPPWVGAWPAETMTALSRDARKLLPRSLNRLLGERESQILGELQRFSPELSRALGQDLFSGRLRPETVAALQAEADRVVELFKGGQVSQGLVRLGGLLRMRRRRELQGDHECGKAYAAVEMRLKPAQPKTARVTSHSRIPP